MKEIQSVLRSISEGKIENNYFLMGNQPYFINLICKKLEEKLISKNNREFDLRLLYGKETSVSEILETVKSYPMFGEKQLVIVREAQYLNKEIKLLLPYLENPLSQTVLVICYVNKTLDSKNKIYKYVSNNSKVIECKQLYESQVYNWISSEAKKLNLNLDPKSIMLIYTNIGLDLEIIQKALEKLSFRSNSQNTIKVEDVEKYIGFSKEYNNFELQNSIGEKKFDKSIFIINQMFIKDNKNPIKSTLSLLHNFFNKLLLIHSKNFNITPKNLGIHPYFLKDYQVAARNFSLEKSIKIIHLLRETDIKSVSINENRGGKGKELKLMLDLILDIIGL
ncbi:MAG: DNA polymerase III subunit delta [Flavobacteriales bacterium]|nr:MAG: DNA polymerase III subunit delta [Flavobacteriales bacterium TMED96]RZP10838.1 MAG: DNA polymerase III subunit delta [Flavobacteriales bacterium]